MASRRTRTFAGYPLVPGKHAFDRYCLRIWPETDRGECHRHFNEAMADFVALREASKAKKKHGRRSDRDTWYILFGGAKPFAILARFKFGYFNGEFVQYFRAITTLDGHDHW